MTEKKFLSWVGYKGGENSSLESASVDQPRSFERIRELEAELVELRSRRDIKSLSKEEFEILATETAISIIRTAQQRESKAIANAERVLNESKRSASAAIEAATAKAKSTLAAAESRGKKYIEAAQADAVQIISKAEQEGQEILANRKREANSIVSASRKEAERLIQGATSAINEFKSWLTQVVSESERLYKIQIQALDSAESSISQSRSRLEGAFSKLSQLQSQVNGSTPRPAMDSVEKVESSRNEASSSSNMAPRTESGPKKLKKEVKKSAR